MDPAASSAAPVAPAQAPTGPPAPAFGKAAGLSYGFLGLPLAFVALPLYVHLPHHYASAFGMSLATLGAVLLAARLFDAFTDPLLGQLADRLFARSHRHVLGAGAIAALLLVLGMAGLFFPPAAVLDSLTLWLVGGLLLTYTAFSQIAIAHQSWGARLGGQEVQRAQVVAWREGAGLAGVVLASVLPSLIGWSGWVAVFGVALALGWLAWCRAPVPVSASIPTTPSLTPNAVTALPALPPLSTRQALGYPWHNPAFRRLMAVFVPSGLASAMPATLLLFFVQDRLGTPDKEPLFLATYFVCAAAGLPLWMRLVRRIGLARAWLAGMLLAVSVFAWAATLGQGDWLGFLAVCALSGLALGADLALPGALLAGLIAQRGDQGQREGAYFGWWNMATKLNLALAAGLVLPLLGLLGYQPGSSDPAGLQALTLAYAVLPCAIKLGAAALLYRFFVRHGHPPLAPVPLQPRQDTP
jgi:glycoside/pentoside/hexuronide:cation symporter, GPH family